DRRFAARIAPKRVPRRPRKGAHRGGFPVARPRRLRREIRPREPRPGPRLMPAFTALASLAAASSGQSYRSRLPQDEVIYFVLPDRFENGDPANDRGGLTG